MYCIVWEQKWLFEKKKKKKFPHDMREIDMENLGFINSL